MSRFRGDYKAAPFRLTFLDDEDLRIIEEKASGLSFEDCLSVLMLTPDEIPPYDLSFAKKAHKRGRVLAISTACDRLFSSMNGRNGNVASLEYLKALSSTFQLEPTSSSNGSGGFSFNVVMPDKNSI